MTPEELIAFEKDIAAEFEAGHIKAPLRIFYDGKWHDPPSGGIGPVFIKRFASNANVYLRKLR